MTTLWPHFLWLTSLVPLLVAVYLWLLRRQKKLAIRFSSVTLVRQAAGRRTAWRRHLPPALLLVAICLLIVATARPTAVVALPTQQQTLMLAMDLSGSMQAADVAPNRLRASQIAAKAFAAKLPRGVRVGVVAYADTAQLVQPPTMHRDDVLAAIDRFQLQGGTAIGEGIVIALAAIFPQQRIDMSDLAAKTDPAAALQPGNGQPPQQKSRAAAGPKPVEPGSYRSAAIVLLTDGQNTNGPDPIAAAQMAADRGVKVFTVGFGTKDGQVLDADGAGVQVRLDEGTLKHIASVTRGEYFHASNGSELQRVYKGLQSRLVMEKKETELTSLFAGAATVVLMLASGLSVWWFGKVT